jgi:hypothetical protein
MLTTERTPDNGDAHEVPVHFGADAESVPWNGPMVSVVL